MTLRTGLLVAVALLFTSIPAFAATSAADQNRIKRYTAQLKKLPERAAPASRIRSLVTKLVNLRPEKATQYYLIGLRKLGLPGAPGKEFAQQLNLQVQRLLRRSDLSVAAQDMAVRRLNKVQRLFTPQPEPTPPPVSPSASLSWGFLPFAA